MDYHISVLEFKQEFNENLSDINVLLVGRKYSGKSTIIHTLINPEDTTNKRDYVETKTISCKTIGVQDNISNKLIKINIIDTPGLSEILENDEHDIYDELERIILSILNEGINHINLLCLVTRAGEFHRLDIEAFKRVQTVFGNDFSRISMLVMTCCDEYAEQAIVKFEKSIQTNHDSLTIFNYCQVGLLKLGAIDLIKLELYDEYLRLSLLKTKVDKVKKMRNNFIKKIISSKMNEESLVELKDHFIRKHVKPSEPDKIGCCGCVIQ